MKKEVKRILKVNSEIINYTVDKKKIKNVYICIRNGEVIVKAPLRVDYKTIEQLILKRKEWINKNIEKQCEKKNRNIDLLNKNYIYILDKKIIIKYMYVDTKSININLKEDKCTISIPKKQKNNDNIIKLIEKKLDLELKRLASIYIIAAIEKYSQMTNLYPLKINIKKFKRIWGNCSSNKEIKINQNIIWFSQREIEYVCLHEIAHLKYMNHQKEVWDFIVKYMPDYKERIEKLK